MLSFISFFATIHALLIPATFLMEHLDLVPYWFDLAD